MDKDDGSPSDGYKNNENVEVKKRGCREFAAQTASLETHLPAAMADLTPTTTDANIRPEEVSLP
jgi:hypothetical protein